MSMGAPCVKRNVPVSYSMLHRQFLRCGTVFFVIICYCSDDAAWVSSGNRPCRNVLCDNTSGTDYHVISDMHAGTHYGISSQPHIIPDRNLFSVFKSGIARVRVNRMSCRINRHIPVCLKYIPCQYPHILHNTAQDILLHLY